MRTQGLEDVKNPASKVLEVRKGWNPGMERELLCVHTLTCPAKWQWHSGENGLTLRMPIRLSEGQSGHRSYHLHNCLSPQNPTYCLGVSHPHLAQREPLFSSLPPAEPSHPHPGIYLYDLG